MKKCALFYYMLKRLDIFLLNFVSHLKKTPPSFEHQPREAPASFLCSPPNAQPPLLAPQNSLCHDSSGLGPRGPSLYALHSSLLC